MLGKAGRQYIEGIKSEIDDIDKDHEDQSWRSAFHHLLLSNIPDSEKSVERLQAESVIFLLAGTLAGAHTLTFVVFYVLSNPKTEACLRDELKSIFISSAGSVEEKMPTWADLERLPYLRGCVKEALRRVQQRESYPDTQAPRLMR